MQATRRSEMNPQALYRSGAAGCSLRPVQRLESQFCSLWFRRFVSGCLCSLLLQKGVRYFERSVSSTDPSTTDLAACDFKGLGRNVPAPPETASDIRLHRPSSVRTPTHARRHVDACKHPTTMLCRRTGGGGNRSSVWRKLTRGVVHGLWHTHAGDPAPHTLPPHRDDTELPPAIQPAPRRGNEHTGVSKAWARGHSGISTACLWRSLPYSQPSRS